ncbi:MAG: hypothetical protein LBR28_03855 [Bacteroidales bacterium]|jgi:hypothetical protein|nr:hypothetical protein [Bacteroidales bacterium]
MGKTSIIFLFNLAFVLGVNAQITPTWVRHEPKVSGAFKFKVVEGFGQTSQEARTDAVNALLNQISAETGIDVSGKIDIKTEFSTADNSYRERNSQVSNYTIKTGDRRIAFSIQDEFHKKGSHYYLVEVADNPENPQFKNLVFSTKYNFFLESTSILVPGLGQCLKGDWKKGLKFFGTEVGLLGLGLGATFAFVASDNKLSDGKGGAEIGIAVFAITLIAVPAIHIWNIIDAYTATGAKHVDVAKTNRKYKNAYKLSLKANANQANGLGLGLVLAF